MIRISRLDLIRWGPFTDRTVNFGDEVGILHVVYGGNEAGKSTTRRGTSALLFGIPGRTQDAHVHAYADLRLGARLIADQGAVEVLRRKGNFNTLLDADGQPVSDALLVGALYGLRADVYAGLFEISHESLVQGGRELLEGRGAVGEALFAAAAGTGRLHRLLTSLDTEAAAIFKPGGRTAPLNLALSAYADAIKVLNASTVRPSRAAELRRAVKEAGCRVDELDGEIRERVRECARARRLKAVKPILARRTQLGSELEELGETPTIDLDARDRRVAAQRERDEAERELRDGASTADQLRLRLDAIDDPSPALEVAGAIVAVHAEIAAVRKAANDRPKRVAELEAEERKLAALLPQIDARLTHDGLDRFDGPERTRRDLIRCLESRGEVFERLRSASEAKQIAQGELQEAERALEDVGTPPANAQLRAALRAAGKAGPLEGQAAGSMREASGNRAQAAVRLARLEPSAGTVARIEQLAVTSREQIQCFLRGDADLGSERNALTLERNRLEEAEADIAARRTALGVHGTAPSVEALAALREKRGRAWSRVRDALTSRVLDLTERADRFERAMDEADNVADARASQAETVAQLVELDAAEARLALDGNRLGREADQLDAREREADCNWQHLWSGVGIEPPKRPAALAWVDEFDAIRALLAHAHECEIAAGSAESLVARHSDVLANRLAAVGISTPPGATLEELIMITESAADKLDAAASSLQQAAAHVRHAEKAVVRAETALGAAQKEATRWHEHWERLRDAYGLAAQLAPEDAADVLRAIDSALAASRTAGDLRRRIDGIDRDREGFAAELERVASMVDPELARLEPEQAAARLMDRLTAAQKAREAMTALEDQLDHEEEKKRLAKERRTTAVAELAALLAAAGVSDETELPEIERRAARAAEIMRELPKCDREIEEVGEDTFETLACEAAEQSVDALTAWMVDHERKLEDSRCDRDGARDALVDVRDRLREVDQSDVASRAAEKAQQDLASVRELAERYAEAKLSARILRDTIERYRKKHQGPLVRRANALFPLLTRESFEGLFVDWDDAGEPILVGRSADGRRVRVEEMSDGTREQLFLALRIAAIERYVESSGAVPVIFDDVFLESDDPRSERILVALADLAQRTQVIVLTHHRHLVRIAQHVVTPDRLKLHNLDDSSPALRAAAESEVEDQRAAA
jgi:uncharacterized protein YhaN